MPRLDYHEVMSTFRLCLVVLTLLLAAAGPLRAAECVALDRKGSRVDPVTKHLIFRFVNKCDEARPLRIWFDGNYFSPVGGKIEAKAAVEIDVGVRENTGAKVYYTDDGSDPKPKEKSDTGTSREKSHRQETRGFSFLWVRM